jgi:hypothetical protein
MTMDKDQFSHLYEFDIKQRLKLSPNTREALLGLEFGLSSELYDSKTEKYIDTGEQQLCLKDIKECPVQTDSTSLREISDYFGAMADVVETIEKISDQKPKFEYKDKFETSPIANKSFTEFVKMFIPKQQ